MTDNTPQSWIQPYYPAFNGLRALAVLLTFFCHFGELLRTSRDWDSLYFGVDLFFVLSGFLITGILYDSLTSPHFFRDFYVRRALRIFPIFYGFFLVLFVATPLLHLHWSAYLLTFPAYVGNLFVPLLDLTRHNPTIISIQHGGRTMPIANIGPLWSLCVEEQFYLIWPAVVWKVRNRQRLMRICAWVIVLELIVRIVLVRVVPNATGQYLLSWSTYTRCDTLLVGAWLALWLRGNAVSRNRLRQIGAVLLAAGTLVLLAPLHFHVSLMNFHDSWSMSVGFTALAVAAAGVLLLSLDVSSRWVELMQWRPLAWLGSVSYGFYFMHAMFFDSVDHLVHARPGSGPWFVLADFLGTLVFAWLSFRFFESPFLRLKGRLAPQRSRHPHVPEPQPVAL